jgi:hypothetical protein
MSDADTACAGDPGRVVSVDDLADWDSDSDDEREIKAITGDASPLRDSPSVLGSAKSNSYFFVFLIIILF